MKRIFSILTVALAALALCCSSCNTDKPAAQELRIVAYYPSYSGGSDFFEPWWDQITHMNLSFCKINADGSINDAAVRRSFSDLAPIAHEHGVKLVVSLGGGGPKAEQDAFATVVIDDNLRARVIENVMQLVEDLDLDGVDIDYEAWGSGNIADRETQTVGLEKLFKEFRAALGDKLLTAALCIPEVAAGYYTIGMSDAMDYYTVMAYDLTGPWSRKGGPHSPYEYFLRGIQNCLDQGFPAAKIVPGVPFYGYGFPNPENTEGAYAKTFAQLVEEFPGSENLDCVNDEIFYDGIPTMTRKCQYVVDNGLGGIMFWQLLGDTRDESKSLLVTINKVFGRI